MNRIHVGSALVTIIVLGFGLLFFPTFSKFKIKDNSGLHFNDLPQHFQKTFHDRAFSQDLMVQHVRVLVSEVEDKTLSDILHQLKLSCDQKVLNDKQYYRQLIVDKKNQEYFGKSSFFVTKYGIRCKTYSASTTSSYLGAQSHTDQALAMLAESGLSLSHPIFTDTTIGNFRDLLLDALANFDVKQSEVEWSCIAFVHLVPPNRAWHDKFGRLISFDDLANALLMKDIGKAPCSGTHLLYAAVSLLRADERYSLLSGEVQRKLIDFVNDSISWLIATQHDDGSWGVDWNVRPSLPVSEEVQKWRNASTDLLVTGHHLEWLLRLPKSIIVPKRQLLNAADYIKRRLAENGENNIQRKEICPYVHAAAAFF